MVSAMVTLLSNCIHIVMFCAIGRVHITGEPHSMLVNIFSLIPYAKAINPRLTKPPLNSNDDLTTHELAFLVK